MAQSCLVTIGLLLMEQLEDSGMISAPSSETGHTFAVAAKLSLPWVQAEVSSGTWVIDN